MTSTAIVTGGSSGLGLALVAELTARGATVVTDARDADRLHVAVAALPHPHRVVALPGDVTDPTHRRALVDAAGGRLDLLVHNAGDLGPSPLPALADLDDAALRALFEANVVAPHALTRAALPLLRTSPAPAIVAISSDAAVAAYPGWGGYGATKAALDRLAAVLGEELPDVAVYAVDPGDMRTPMHQRAFPGEDISDRPEPRTVVPALLRLLDERPPAGRYRAADLSAVVA